VSQYAKNTEKYFYSGECRDRLPLQQDFIDGEKDQGYSTVGDEFGCIFGGFVRG